MVAAEYLTPTEFIEAEAPAIVELARRLSRPTPQQTAVALFDWVRDNIEYDPLKVLDPRELYRASAVLERGSGFCIQKAVLLAALARAAGIPSRLGFADVRNHKLNERMRKLMGTNLFVFHGYVELFLADKWVKATPAFDRATAKKAGALLVELDGINDATMHPVDPQGSPYMEYVRSRGVYADLPLEEIQRTLIEVYRPDEPIDL